MSITLHTGRPGTGKTYSLTRNIIKYLKQGYRVYCNYKLFPNNPEIEKFLLEHNQLVYWKNPRDLLNIREGIVAMDEAHVYFNSRKWKDLPEEFLRLLAQHRKKGLHIEGTVQHVNRIDTVMRELVDFWYTYSVKPFFFVRYEFDIDQDKQKKYPLSQRWILKRKKIYNFYDTLQTIDF